MSAELPSEPLETRKFPTLPNKYRLTNNPIDYTLLNELSEDMSLAYFKKGTLERPEIIELRSNSVKNMYDKLDSLVEKNKRYQIGIKWKAQDSSHVMCIYRNNQDILEIYDPQSGEIFTGKSINLWRLNYAEIGRKHKNGKNWPIRLMRVDDLVIDERMAEYIMEGK